MSNCAIVAGETLSAVPFYRAKGSALKGLKGAYSEDRSYSAGRSFIGFTVPSRTPNIITIMGNKI